MRNNIRIRDSDWSANLWARVRALFNGVSAEVAEVGASVPTKTSDITNDGDGASPFATQVYVETNGGKIDAIKVNGAIQQIINKTVDIALPTKVSDLDNDSTFQTAAEVSAAVSAAVASVYRYRGSVSAYQGLPTNPSIGDVYDVQSDGMNYAWNGSTWDALGGAFDSSALWNKDELIPITAAEIDQIVFGQQEGTLADFRLAASAAPLDVNQAEASAVNKLSAYTWTAAAQGV